MRSAFERADGPDDNNSGRSLYPSANGNGITFRQLNDDMTLIEGDAGKCLSQQWCGKEDCIGGSCALCGMTR